MRRSIVEVIDDAVCGEYKYDYSCVDWDSFESEEGRYDFADYIGGTYSQSIQQELATLMFVELNPATQAKTIRDLKEIMKE